MNILQVLTPSLQVLSDFFKLMMRDDQHDLCRLSYEGHASILHHGNWGTIGFSMCETAIGLINFGNKALAHEENVNRRLREILASENEYRLHDLFGFLAEEVRKDREQRQKYSDERIRPLMEYFAKIKRGDPLEREIIHMGNLDRIRTRPRRGYLYGRPALPSSIPPRPKPLTLS